jgi:hypothetical protein
MGLMVATERVQLQGHQQALRCQLAWPTDLSLEGGGQALHNARAPDKLFGDLELPRIGGAAIEDEIRHHRLFTEFAKSLKTEAELREEDPIVPHMDSYRPTALRYWTPPRN